MYTYTHVSVYTRIDGFRGPDSHTAACAMVYKVVSAYIRRCNWRVREKLMITITSSPSSTVRPLRRSDPFDGRDTSQLDFGRDCNFDAHTTYNIYTRKHVIYLQRDGDYDI